MELTPYGWMALALAAFLFGMAKTGIPGLGSLAIPIAAMALPAKQSTGLVLPMLILGDFLAVAWYRRSADWSKLWIFMPWALAGVVAGCASLGFVDDATLRRLIGCIVAAMLALHLLRNRGGAAAPPPTSKAYSASMGFIGGVTTMMANAAGPIMAIYLLSLRMDKTRFLGTAAWFFLVVNLVKVPFSAGLGLITAQSLWVNLTLAPLLIAGTAAGILVNRRINEESFGVIVQILAAAAAAHLIFS